MRTPALGTGSLGVLALASLVALSGCPESPGFASPLDQFAGTPFSQADVSGDWRYAAIFHGAGVAAGTSRGWERGTLRVGTSGAVTALSALASDGSGFSSAPSPWTVDKDGFVTAPAGSYVGFNLKVNARRTMAAATGTTAGTSAALWILLRASPATSFSNTDLAGTTWSYHRLTTGATPSWEHGVASADAARVLSFTALVAQGGPQPERPSAGVWSVDASGAVTLDADPTWLGQLSADKDLLVATRTAGSGLFALEVYVRRGQSYVLEDLVGRSSSHSIVAGPGGAAGWSVGVYTVDGTGQLTWVSSLTNAGQTSLPQPSSVGLALAPDGTVTSPPIPTLHSTVLCSKDGSVRTSTSTGGVTYSSLAINVR